MTTDLPAWKHVLVVVAHPDDESFGLGAVIAAFTTAGAAVDVLCFTHGEASALGAHQDLAYIRAQELQEAAVELGVLTATLLDLPDGRLAQLPETALTGPVSGAIDASQPDGILVFAAAGLTGHPDHVAATEAAMTVASARQIPVLAWVLPTEVAQVLNEETGAGFIGYDHIDITLTVDRTIHRRAIDCHRSQAVADSPLWRRLELQGDIESLVYLAR